VIHRIMVPVCLAIAFFLSPTGAHGQCETIDFESFPVGTAITNQVVGVVFSVVPDSCPQPLFMRITNPAGGTSSPTRALGIDAGCPDFSPDYVRMVFDNLQMEVTFTIGASVGSGTYSVRAYAGASGGAPLSTQVIPAGAAVRTFVRVSSATRNIRRIEIQENIGLFEYLDDLLFDLDETPPTADIVSPVGSPVSHNICGCGQVGVTGIACDDDGEYGRDTLQYRSSGEDTWFPIGAFSSPACEISTLYIWDTTDVVEGFYDLLLTVENACGLQATDFTTVYVDKHFDLESDEVRSPQNGDIVGGNLCVDGTVWDRCFSQYRVDYRPAGVGDYVPVSAGQPTYTETVLNDPLANWNTHTVADGDYDVRVRGTDLCGNVAEVDRLVTVDNTPPVALISMPEDCRFVEGTVDIMGTANDTHLLGWTLSYIGGDADTWTPIGAGNAPVVDGLLGQWDTTSLPTCAYLLRLRVTDQSRINCYSDRNIRDYYVPVSVGVCVDFDSDNDGDVDLIDFRNFQDEFTGPLP